MASYSDPALVGSAMVCTSYESIELVSKQRIRNQASYFPALRSIVRIRKRKLGTAIRKLQQRLGRSSRSHALVGGGRFHMLSRSCKWSGCHKR